MKSFSCFLGIVLVTILCLFTTGAYAQKAPVPLGVITLTASDTLLDPGQTSFFNPVYKIGALTGNITLTLPHLSTTAGAQHITVINMFNQGSNTITFAAQSGDSVNGATTYTGLTQQYQEVTFWCDPSISGKWFLLDNGYSTAGGSLTGTYPNPTVRGLTFTSKAGTATLTTFGVVSLTTTVKDTITLPAANAAPAGGVEIFTDQNQGGADSIYLKPAGSDTLNNATAVVLMIKTAGATYRVVTDGVRRWSPWFKLPDIWFEGDRRSLPSRYAYGKPW